MFRSITSAVAVVVVLAANSANANDFGVSSIPSAPSLNSVPNVPVMAPQSNGGGAWVRPIPDFSGNNRPGVVGGYQGQGLSGTVLVQPGSNSVSGGVSGSIPGS